MPEGHTLFRLARDLNDAYEGTSVAVSSPQGKFADSAALIDGTTLVRAESAGKHLFIEFDTDDIVHIHLGLIGKFDLGQPREVIGQVRLRLSDGVTIADLRGATQCALITAAQRAEVISKLGPDPLRSDAQPSLAWEKIRCSSRTIGELLMDQSVIAGVGNVYRAEVLFRQKIHPDRPGRAVSAKQWQAIWVDLVELMADGVRLGRIDTVRPEHTPEAMGRDPRVDDHGGEVYVYRRAQMPCYVCDRPVRTKELGGRNSFWCAKCQPTYRGKK